MTGGYCGRLLLVDMDTGRTDDMQVPSRAAERYLGGKGFGVKLLYDLVGPEIDPLSPDNVVMFLTGPLTGTAAPAMRGVVVTKSPLSGTFCDSYYGGHFAHELKYSGYDGVIVRGRASNPAYLYIDGGKVEIRDAGFMWGKDTYDTYDAIKAALGDNRVKIACIGPAGERLVRFACVDCSPHRQAGRGGAGAVMGSKNLKAIVVRGASAVPVSDSVRLMDILHRCHERARSRPNSHTQAGTTGAVDFANEMGFFPVRNYKYGTMENASDLIGTSPQRERFWLRDLACSGCMIRCTKHGILKGGRRRGLEGDTIEYETLGLIGGNLGLQRFEEVAYAGNLCDRLGMHTISTGSAVGFAIECYDNGLISRDETGGLDLRFGDSDSIISLIGKIAAREDIGDLLADGVKRAATALGRGAEDYAVHVKGLEVPAWSPRGANSMGLEYMTSDRGACHMRSWPISAEMSGESYPGGRATYRDPHGIGGLVAWQQNLSAACWSLVQCDFGRDVVDIEMALEFLSAATGMDISPHEFALIGERIWNMTRLYNLREGFSARDDTLPKRFREEPLPDGPSRGHRFTDEICDTMRSEYYRYRGWEESGVPSSERLAELGLEEMVDTSTMESTTIWNLD